MPRLMLAFAIVLVLSSAAEGQTIRVATQPSVSIGTVDGDPNYLLSRVAHVRRLSDGRIMVTMGPDIRFYDRNGRHLGNAGGRGRGPGEFQHIGDVVVLPGDTLMILNSRDKVWLSPDGKYIRQEAMDLTPLAADGWFSEGSVLLPDGNLLATQYEREKPNDPRMQTLHRPVLRYSLYNLSTKKLQPLITSGGLRQIVRPGGGGGVQRYSPHAQHAVGADRVYVGDNDTTFLSVFSLDGRPLGDIRVAERATRVTSAHLDEVHRRTLEQIGDDQQRRTRYEQSRSAVPTPERFPYWGRAIADKAGYLWVSSTESLNTPVTWTVYDRSGRRVGRVELPARFRPLEIGHDYVLGIAFDEFDVEHVRLYTLTRQPR